MGAIENRLRRLEAIPGLESPVLVEVVPANEAALREAEERHRDYPGLVVLIKRYSTEVAG